MRATDSPALPLLRSAVAVDLYRLDVVWRDGRSARVDLGPHILRYAVYRPLRDDWTAFAALAVIDGGVAIAWAGDGLDLSADAIAALERTQTMSAEDFRGRLVRLGLSFDAAAATFGISRRQIAYYASGAKPVPRHLVLAVHGLEAEVAGAP